MLRGYVLDDRLRHTNGVRFSVVKQLLDLLGKYQSSVRLVRSWGIYILKSAFSDEITLSVRRNGENGGLSVGRFEGARIFFRPFLS